MDFEGIMPGDRSDKDKYCMISLMCRILKKKTIKKKEKQLIHRKRSDLWLPEAEGGGRWSKVTCSYKILKY